MNKRTELACLWCLPVGLALFTIGWILAHYFPPPSSAMSAHDLQAFYIHHASDMRIAFNLMVFGGFFIVPFVVAVTCEMFRIEGPHGPLAYTQLVMGVLGAVAFMVPLFSFAAAIYRPDSDPQLIRALNDMFWLPYLLAIWPFVGQAVAVGLLALRRIDRNPLPRWFGYACLACSAAFLPTMFGIGHKTGALSPTGLIALWIPTVATYVWYVLMMVVFHRAIATRSESAGDERPEPAPSIPEASRMTPDAAPVGS